MVSTWDELVDLANPNVRVLVEANPRAYYACGATWISEGSSTYSHPCLEVKVNATTDDGVEMTERATIALVKANAGSWYFDKQAQLIYVRCFDDDDLSAPATTTVVMVFCWKMFSTDACEFNGIQYMPVVRQDSIPMLDLAVDDLVEGMYRFNFGSFQMNNPGWFDTAAENYLWTNCNVLIKLGGEDLPYSEHLVYFAGRISDYFVSDEEVTFSVKDLRVGTYAQIPIDHYWVSNYPKLAAGWEGRPIPVFYGIKTNIIPTCINTNRPAPPYDEGDYPSGSVWKIAGRKIKEVTKVTLNLAGLDELVLTETTHYTVDLNNGEFTLLIPLISGDYLEVDAKGIVDGSNNLMEKAGEIAKDILKTYLGYIDDDLDLTSFTTVDTTRPYEICMYLDTDKSSRQVLQTIGRSVIGFFTPVESGKLAFEIYVGGVPAGTMSLSDRDFGDDWKVKLDDFFIRNKVKVQYNQNPKTQEFEIVEKTNYAVLYKYGVRETLNIETYLREASDAGTIAQAIQNLCSTPVKIVETSCGIKAFKLFPTRKVKLTRSRAVDTSGAWTDKLFRVKEIVKDNASERTRLFVADDFQLLGDIPHVNIAHVNTAYSHSVHTDTPHTDTPHENTAHSNSPHTDISHVNTPHTHVPHQDGGTHTDDPHEDIWNDEHDDTPHYDHEDAPHVNIPYSHTPHTNTGHSDSPHEDHFDEVDYTDEPHEDETHENIPHVDDHVDNPHVNTAYSHTPHTDTPHTNTPHQDTPHFDTSV